MTVAEQHDQPELATGDGGGVWTEGDTMTVNNSTVTGNHAVNGMASSVWVRWVG